MYVTRNDLYTSVRGLDATNTKATPEYLDDLIKRKEAIIASHLVLYGTITEADSPISFSILKDIQLILCRREIAEKLQVVSKDINQTTVMPSEKTALERLGAIGNGTMPLVDAPKLNPECNVFCAGSYAANIDDTTLTGI